MTAGTLFADTHLPLRLWFEALWHVTSQKSGASALGLQRVFGLGSYRTAWNCCTSCAGQWFAPDATGERRHPVGQWQQVLAHLIAFDFGSEIFKRPFNAGLTRGRQSIQ